MIGFDDDDILRIIDIEGLSAAELEALIRKEGIRDAVAFQEERSDSNNHFVQLVINGEARSVEGLGSGANPRTGHGQRGRLRPYARYGRKGGHPGIWGHGRRPHQ
jgi:hypothetical protein